MPVAIKRGTLPTVFSSLLIVLFVYTSIAKLSEPNKFATVISQSPLIGSAAHSLRWIVPGAEIVTAILLFVPQLRKWGFAGSVFLMVLFTTYVGYMLLVTPHLPCSCGGVIGQMTWKQHFWFNVLFTVVAVAGFYMIKN